MEAEELAEVLLAKLEAGTCPKNRTRWLGVGGGC